MAGPREHIEEIRRKKFSIGGEKNPLTEDLHQAVKNLSAELYAKDVHFLMELIQNAEDNEYPEGAEPSLEFVITSEDITATGAPATLLLFNNEIGFSRENVESICSVGRSTKKGNRKRDYIGEKGIGFKSVFLISSRPYIFSNGYQICFNEEPCQHSGLGYVVPEWVDQNPTLSEIELVYGSSSSLPTTTLILPLKPDKVLPVKRQLSAIHPQVLLFLAKIKRLSVKKDDADPRLSTVNAIAITRETDFVQRKNIDAESFTLHLSAEEDGAERKCGFYMWKQRFAVSQHCRVDQRAEIDEWAITLAFPIGERLRRGGLADSPGIYAFLPTEMVTNLPFIIQADFLLSSSRETIRLDSKWNAGILDCVPVAFVNAFKSLVKVSEDVPVWNLPELFRFLPVDESSYEELNSVREKIKAKLMEEDIVPSEAPTDQKLFHRPCDVGRLMPSFWSLLSEARNEGVRLSSLSSHGKFVLESSFDRAEYDPILNFLEVKPVDSEWYGKCIRGSCLVDGVSEAVYLRILLFVADNWSSKFHSTNVKNIPLLKYEDLNGELSLLSVAETTLNSQSSVYLSRHGEQVSWLIEWNKEFGSETSRVFIPRATQEAMKSCSRQSTLLQWLQSHANIGVIDAYDFAQHLCGCLKQRKHLISFVHFLYHSFAKKEYLSELKFDNLCRAMRLVNKYGCVVGGRNAVLMPAEGSKWAGLLVSNLWRNEGYVELSEDYLSPGWLAGKQITAENELVGFLRDRVKAEDVPGISPPNAPIPAVSAPLTKANAFLLLEWIRSLRVRGVRLPESFLESIKEGSWLRITLKGWPDFRPPAQSFMLDSSALSWGNLLQHGSVLVDIPLVDRSYYGEGIKDYLAELKAVGVKSEYAEACEFIGGRLMSLANSGSLTSENVLSILRFIKFLTNEYLSPKEFIVSVNNGRWLKTSLGDRSPSESVWFDESWSLASRISNLPVNVRLK